MSPTSKPSKQSEPTCESWIIPSGLSRGDLVSVVHVTTGHEIHGRVLSIDPGVGCRLRPVNEQGVTLVQDHHYIMDKFYTVRKHNGHEMH